MKIELEKGLDDSDDIVTPCTQKRRQMLDDMHVGLDREIMVKIDKGKGSEVG